jgi:iron(III) transport system substrate-binding protein
MLTRKKVSVLWIYLGLLMLLGSWFRPGAAIAASDDNWKATLAKARQEGSLVLATSVGLPQYRQSLTSTFARRFGISLEVRAFGTGAELDAVAGRECAAGRQTIDVVQTGSGAPPHLYPKKCLTEVGSRLMLPEVVDPRKWRGGHLKWLDPEKQFLLQTAEAGYGWIVINNDQVKAGEISSAKDLLKPEYKGKIASYDLRRPGSAQGFAAYLVTLFGDDYIRRLFVEQKVTFSSDHRQVGEWAARAVHPVALGLVERTVEPFRQQNLPVEVINLSDAPICYRRQQCARSDEGKSA